MKKFIVILALCIPSLSFAQDDANKEIELTPELKNYLDDFTYQVVLFKYGTIIPMKDQQENIEQIAKNELQKAVENKYGLDFATQSYNPLDLDGVIVFDHQDVRNYVIHCDSFDAMQFAKENRKMDGQNPEIIYISN